MNEVIACTWKRAIPFQDTAKLGPKDDALQPPVMEHERFWFQECQQHPNRAACRLFEL